MRVISISKPSFTKTKSDLFSEKQIQTDRHNKHVSDSYPLMRYKQIHKVIIP